LNTSPSDASKRKRNTIIAGAAVLVILVVAAVAAYSLNSSSSTTSTTSSTTSSTTGVITSSTSSASSTSVNQLATFPYGGGPFNTPGNLLITDQLNNRVIEVNPLTNQIVWSFGSGNGSLCNPGPGSIIGPNDAERLAGGLTLIAGTGNPAGFKNAVACVDNRVIIVNQQGAITWQYGQANVTGFGPNELNTPVFAIQLPNQNIMIVDQGNNRVIEVNSTKQIVWSYGPASGPTALKNPNSVEMLANGDFLIADQNNNRALEVNPAGTIVGEVVGGLHTVSFASRLPNNDTLIADASNQRVIEINQQNQTVWQYYTNMSAGSNPTPYPANAVRLADGDTSIADWFNQRIVVVNSQNQTVYQYGMTNVPGNGPNQLYGPYTGFVIGDYTGQTVPPGETTPPASSTPMAPAGITAVMIPNGSGSSAKAAPGYSPNTVTVVIGVNNTVVWTNDDVVDHTVSSTSVPAGATTFDSGMIAPGGNYTQTFTVAGTYPYHCNIHSWMTGTIIVKSG
jgi:plastocyanin